MLKRVQHDENKKLKMNEKKAERDFPYFSVEDFLQFPNPEKSKSGVIATGGNLSPGMLLSAYLQGIFPWFSDDDPLLWWCPDPRFVLFPNELHIPKSLRRTLNQKVFSFSIDACFEKVITSCAKQKRIGQNSTWITDEMIEAYCDFYKEGFAHSVEAWKDGELVGGFYGVNIGSVFYGESMFSHFPNASKAAFCTFVKAFKNAGGKLIDSQVYTDHVARFGGKNISRTAFLHYLKEYLPQKLETKIEM